MIFQTQIHSQIQIQTQIHNHLGNKENVMKKIWEAFSYDPDDDPDYTDPEDPPDRDPNNIGNENA